MQVNVCFTIFISEPYYDGALCCRPQVDGVTIILVLLLLVCSGSSHARCHFVDQVLSLMEENRELTEEAAAFEERLHQETRRAEKRRLSAANRADLEVRGGVFFGVAVVDADGGAGGAVAVVGCIELFRIVSEQRRYTGLLWDFGMPFVYDVAAGELRGCGATGRSVGRSRHKQCWPSLPHYASPCMQFFSMPCQPRVLFLRYLNACKHKHNTT